MFEQPWTGVYPATLCPFTDDYAIDEPGLRAYVHDLVRVPGIQGLVCNGHTGEVMSLRAAERVRVVEIIADAVGERTTVVSAVCCEGSLEAIDHARAAQRAGASAILLMPPHHWLRFGRTAETAVGFVRDVAEGAAMPIIVHQYPSWTKASYTLEELLAIVQIPAVVSLKIGTRDLARLGHDYRVLKEAAPRVTHLSCHDEYLLASLLEGADGALVGFAGFVPELIVELVAAALAGDLAAARRAQERVYPLARIVYRFGEPSSDAHQRMKAAMTMLGRFPSLTMRPPLRPLGTSEIQRIGADLAAAGYDLAVAVA